MARTRLILSTSLSVLQYRFSRLQLKLLLKLRVYDAHLTIRYFKCICAFFFFSMMGLGKLSYFLAGLECEIECRWGIIAEILDRGDFNCLNIRTKGRFKNTYRYGNFTWKKKSDIKLHESRNCLANQCTENKKEKKLRKNKTASSSSVIPWPAPPVKFTSGSSQRMLARGSGGDRLHGHGQVHASPSFRDV